MIKPVWEAILAPEWGRSDVAGVVSHRRGERR
jgi:hypothetical protein